MKISKIHIQDFYQFKNLELDLTYPKDYYVKEKAGKPLDKVCFIGQSGTGKTTILQLIKTNAEPLDYRRIKGARGGNDSLLPLSGKVDIIFDYKNATRSIYSSTNNKGQSGKSHGSFKINGDDVNGNEFEKFEEDYFKNESIISFFIPHDINSKNLVPFNSERPFNFNYIDYSVKNPSNFWSFILDDIRNWRKEKFYRSEKYSNESRRNPEKFLELKRNEDEWERQNPNPLKLLADKLIDPMLEDFGLSVKIENDENVIENLSEIPLQSKYDSSIVDLKNASSGTKQFIYTSVPLYKFHPQKSIIMIDEPENSFFASTQQKLVDIYSSLTDDCQFFYATHSPIIAASFEPEERICLYFNEDGTVGYKKGVAPKGDDPNDLLKKDFGLTPLMNEFGEKIFQKYVDLGRKIKLTDDKILKENLQKEQRILGEKYNF